MKHITAFAPATVANVAVGFDILGFPLNCAGDRVTVTRVINTQKTDSPVQITSITGCVTDLPHDPHQNTATVGMLALLHDLKCDMHLTVAIEKGISMGSGMGGSAASAVAALVATNALLDKPLPTHELLHYATLGESAASGSMHADNVAPCLLGGLQLIRSYNPLETVHIPTPKNILCVLIHPHATVETQAARKMLSPTITLEAHVKQSANLATFMAACFTSDLTLLKKSLHDTIIEPQRAALITGFEQTQRAAMIAGAPGCSNAGSGPSMFAWASDHASALRIQASMTSAMHAQNIQTDSWISPISQEGAKVIA